MKKQFLLALCFCLGALPAFGSGNETNESFAKAKKMLERQVYFDHRFTIYCGAEYDSEKNVLCYKPKSKVAQDYEKFVQEFLGAF